MVYHLLLSFHPFRNYCWSLKSLNAQFISRPSYIARRNENEVINQSNFMTYPIKLCLQTTQWCRTKNITNFHWKQTYERWSFKIQKICRLQLFVCDVWFKKKSFVGKVFNFLLSSSRAISAEHQEKLWKAWYKAMNITYIRITLESRGGGLIYETDGDARRLA